MNMEEIREKLAHYYELDLNNCLMSHEDWIDELAKALSNPTAYKEEFDKEYEEYKEMLNA
jgi:hypothetical protein